MTFSSLDSLKWGAAILLGLSFGGFAFAIARAMGSGAGAYADSMSEETSRQFEDLFLFFPAKRIREIGWAVASAVFMLFAIPFFDLSNMVSTSAGLILGITFGGLALMAPAKLVLVMREKRRQKFNIQLVDALGSMSNALRAGFSINQAFETVVQNGEKPISQEFGVLLQQMRVGMNFYDALQSLDKRVGSDDLTLVVTSIDIARRTGGNLTEIFDKISLTIRERMRIESRVRTLTAQGRLQGIIVGGMPIVLGIVLTVIRPSMMLPFLASLTGMIAIFVVLILLTLGALMIRKIIRIDV